MKKLLILIILALLALGSGYGLRYKFRKTNLDLSNVPTVVVKQGEFIIGLNDTGIIKAKNSSMVIAPQLFRTWNALKITKLLPEGTKVKKGDPICWFDTTDIDKQ